jgi:hypothetical protein
MAVTIAVVTENVCMNRHQKAYQVAYGIHKQPLTIFTLLMPLNLRNPSMRPVCPDQFSTLSCLQKPIAVKP